LDPRDVEVKNEKEDIMAIISITGALFTHSDQSVTDLSSALGYKVLTDENIMEETARNQEFNLETIQKVLDSKSIPFNDFTHEKEKIIAGLKKTISGQILKGDVIFHGLFGHLIPRWVTHVLRVLIVTDKEARILNGISLLNQSEKEVTQAVNEADKQAILWVNGITGKKAWDDDLYDIVAPSDKLTVSDTVSLISEHHATLTSMSGEVVKKEAWDFSLAAEVEVALATTGGGLKVYANNGAVTVTIDKNVLWLSKFKQKIIGLTKKVEGVTSVETKIGKNYYKSDSTYNLEFETPLHVLLVDDEKEFVQTLSQRLQIRQIDSDVVYSGEEALETVHRDGAEVMVLDLKMPGVDGFQVLREIKKSKPEIEVIILTGHGTEKDKETCMDLGAFAYLQKPADIDLLAETMKQAYEKINRKKLLAGMDADGDKSREE